MSVGRAGVKNVGNISPRPDTISPRNVRGWRDLCGTLRRCRTLLTPHQSSGENSDSWLGIIEPRLQRRYLPSSPTIPRANRPVVPDLCFELSRYQSRLRQSCSWPPSCQVGNPTAHNGCPLWLQWRRKVIAGRDSTRRFGDSGWPALTRSGSRR